jgi:hypothetical protein
MKVSGSFLRRRALADTTSAFQWTLQEADA